MGNDLPAEPSLGGWQRSLQRLAAWMARGNRVPEVSRLESPARQAASARSDEPSRHLLPPRP